MKSGVENSKSKVPEWEVLPPERQGAGDKPGDPLVRLIALFMDNLFRVPGTNFRIGLDPIIGLIPGVGDTSSAMISAMALVQGARQGLPKIILARMAVNILLNQLVGIIPVFGDAFSFWFKSNQRNYDLIRQHSSGAIRAARPSDWIFVIGVLIALAVIVCAGLIFGALLLRELVRIVTS